MVEVVQLHGHVHSYPLGDPDRFHLNLQACSAVIEKLNIPRPFHYCYPSGQFDYMASSVLSAEGVLTATTCIPGMINHKMLDGGQHYLPRFLDGGDVYGLEFEAEVSGVTDLP